jgi:hypothetical protein
MEAHIDFFNVESALFLSILLLLLDARVVGISGRWVLLLN